MGKNLKEATTNWRKDEYINILVKECKRITSLK